MKTFEEGKNANELQIDKDRKFIVVEWVWYYRKWDILILTKDDNSSKPYFIRESDELELFYPWKFLSYYEEEELKTGDEVLVRDNDYNEEFEKIFLFKKGRYYYCIDKEEWEDDDDIYIDWVHWECARKKPTEEENKEMSVDEIEKELWYKIKIVNKWK